MKQNEIEIYKEALNKWGEYSQIMMLFEEMSELQNAICKFYRGRCQSKVAVTEIADVMIMTEQMADLFGADEVVSEKKRKFERLQKRLERGVK